MNYPLDLSLPKKKKVANEDTENTKYNLASNIQTAEDESYSEKNLLEDLRATSISIDLPSISSLPSYNDHLVAVTEDNMNNEKNEDLMSTSMDHNLPTTLSLPSHNDPYAALSVDNKNNDIAYTKSAEIGEIFYARDN